MESKLFIKKSVAMVFVILMTLFYVEIAESIKDGEETGLYYAYQNVIRSIKGNASNYNNVFDTGEGTYPSIFGFHNGTIIPNQTITVSKLYTYPCPGKGGHTEYAKIWNKSGFNITAIWEGYKGDWHNITFDKTFTLVANETYNYTIRTGSYPQIIHEPSKEVTGGKITCGEFIDANGKIYHDWIPAIRLLVTAPGPSLEAEINPRSLYSGESFQTTVTLVATENLNNLFFHNSIISPGKAYYWNPDPNTYTSSSDIGTLHVKAGEIYTSSWNWTLPADAESGEWTVLVGSYYGSNKTLYMYKELTINVTLRPSLEAEINKTSLYSGESFQTNVTLVATENLSNLFFNNTIISPGKAYYWNPDPNTYNSSSDIGTLHVKAGEIYTSSWNWTLPGDAESGEWNVLVGSYYGSNKTLYMYKELTINATLRPSLEAEINKTSLYSGESFQTNVTLVATENLSNLFFHNSIISPGEEYYWNPDPNTYNSSSDIGTLHVKAGEIYTSSWNWTLPADAESGEWTVLVGSYYGSNKTLYLYEAITINVTAGPEGVGYPEWVWNARVAGALVYPGMNDSEIHSLLQEFKGQYVNVIEADSEFSNYLNDSEFDKNVAFMKKFIDEAHKYGFRVIWYIPALEVITPAGPNKTVKNSTMYKDHPDWVQYCIDKQPNVFYGSALVHWLEEGEESAWMNPLSGYRPYFLNRIKKMSGTGVDGLWIDVPLFMDVQCSWADHSNISADRFRADTDCDLPEDADFYDPVFRLWIKWRYTIIKQFLEDIDVTAKSINPDIIIVPEILPVDYNSVTKYGLDAAYLKKTNLVYVMEIDPIDAEYEKTSMKYATYDDWISMLAMFKHSRAASGDKPTWAFCYGYKIEDSEVVISLATASGTNPYETKTPEMCTSVGKDFRSKIYRWIKNNELFLFKTNSNANVGILYSSPSRDYTDKEEGLANIYPTVLDENIFTSSFNSYFLAEYRGLVKSLVYTHTPFDIITDVYLTIDDLKPYEMVLLPDVTCMSDEQASILRAYVSGGGKVFITGENTSLFNEYGSERSDYALSDLLGFHKGDDVPSNKTLSYGSGKVYFYADLLGKKFYVEDDNDALIKIKTVVEDVINPVVITNASHATFFNVNINNYSTILHMVNFEGEYPTKQYNAPENNIIPENRTLQTINVKVKVPENETIKLVYLSSPDFPLKSVEFSKEGNYVNFEADLYTYTVAIIVYDTEGFIPPFAPDITLSSSDITFDPVPATEGDNITITATIHNIGEIDANNFTVLFYDGNPNNGGTLIGSDNISVANDSVTNATVRLDTPGYVGSKNIFVVADSTGEIMELDEDNNIAHKTLVISPQISSMEKILVVYDSADTYRIECKNNTIKSLEYAKILYDTCDLNSSGQFDSINLLNYTCIAFCTENIEKIASIKNEEIKKYVYTGGSVVVLYGGHLGDNEDLYDLFGISSGDYDYYPEPGLMGIYFTESLYPGTKGLMLNETEFSTSALNYTLYPNVNIIARALTKTTQYPEGVPLVWVYHYGRGKTLYWNINTLNDKEFRGFITQSILRTQSKAVASIANIGVIYIDDVSLPMYNIKKEPIRMEYNVTDTEFYTNIWYPDMINLSDKYDINYTTAVVFNYNGKLIPPFEMEEWFFGANNASMVLERNIINNTFEVGLHGYNHQPLTTNRSIAADAWDNASMMKQALTVAKNSWANFSFGDLPFCYVPPNNIYDSTGLQALHEVFPTIKVIGGDYSGIFCEGGNREFGAEPWNPDFYNIPRITDGYHKDQIKEIATVSEIGMFGVWTHFVHPDDVYDIGGDRNPNNETWGQLYNHFDEWLYSINKTYPWLRYMSAREAYYELQKYDSTNVTYSITNEKIMVNYQDYQGPIYFTVRLNDGSIIENTHNCAIIYEYPDIRYYVLKSTGNSTISLK